MTKRRKKVGSTSAKIAKARGLLKRAGKILDSIEDEQSEPESALDRLSHRAYASAQRLYPSKPRSRSKKKSKKKSGNT